MLERRATATPTGYDVDHNRIELGKGQATWLRAVEAVRKWRMFRMPWVSLRWSNFLLRVGTDVAVSVRHFEFYSLNALLAESRLPTVEHIKEHRQAETAKRIDEWWEYRHRRNQVPDDIEERQDKLPHEQNGHHNGSEKCQQCCSFQGHGRSMEGGRVGGNSGSREDRRPSPLRSRMTVLGNPLRTAELDFQPTVRPTILVQSSSFPRRRRLPAICKSLKSQLHVSF